MRRTAALAAFVLVVVLHVALYVQYSRAAKVIHRVAVIIERENEAVEMQKVTRRVGAEVTHSSVRPRTLDRPRWAERFARQVNGDPDHVSCWESGGATYTVETWCDPGQTPQECQAAHNDAVAELQEEFPDEGPCE